MTPQYPITKISTEAITGLCEIPDAPQSLYMRGSLKQISPYTLTVIGSRKYSPYGERVCRQLIRELTGYPITIISGLALGIDAIAHQSALDAGLTTIAFPGSGLDDTVLYPRSNYALARHILAKGGALLSEYEPHFKATAWSFPKRNRLMAGSARATLVIEAQRPSGTLITARLATEYNRDVFAVPGSIYSKTSDGANFLISLGATPITSGHDILEQFSIDPQSGTIDNKWKYPRGSTEEKIIRILSTPHTRSAIAEKCSLSLSECSIILSRLEIAGVIIERNGYIHTI